MAQPANKGRRYVVAKTVAQDASIPHVDLDGVVLHVETFGDAKNTPVIVVHGGPGWDFRELLPLQALSDEYFVVSSCNDILDVEFQEQQMKFFPNARMAVIENVGHDMFEEDPESSVAAVRAFFSSTPSAGAGLPFSPDSS